MKPFKIHWRHRQGGTLEDFFESVETTSKAAAIRWAKSIAAERGWWFVEVFPL